MLADSQANRKRGLTTLIFSLRILSRMMTTPATTATWPIVAKNYQIGTATQTLIVLTKTLMIQRKKRCLKEESKTIMT